MQPSRGSTQTKNAEASFSQPVGGNFVFIFIMRRINILQTGMIYIFNIIVGTGALALPKAFQQGGYVLSTLLLLTLGFFR